MKVIIFFAMAFMSSITWSESIELTAVGDPWPVLLNPNSQQQGLLVEIVRKAYKTQGYDLKIKFVPWSRAMVMIQKKQADLLIGAWYTDERNDYLLYSDIIFASAIRFIKPRNSTFEYQGLESLKGKRIGTILSYQYNKEFLSDIGIKRITSDSLLNNIHNLLAGRIDLTLDDHYVVKYMLDKHVVNWEKELSLVEEPLTSKNLYLAANRSNPKYKAIIEAFNLGLAQLKKEQRYDKIIDSYDLED